MEVKTVQEWRKFIYPALVSKRSEFKLIGYREVSIDEIWRCLEERVWKGNPTKRLHEVVQDIFHLPATTYMNFITVSALHVEEKDLLASIQELT